MWQDVVIAVVSLLFGFMMFPQVRSSFRGQHINKWTGWMTTVGMAVMGITFFTMGMWLTAASEFFVGGMWVTVSYLSTIDYCVERPLNREEIMQEFVEAMRDEG